MAKKEFKVKPGKFGRTAYLMGKPKNELIKIHRTLFTGNEDPGRDALSLMPNKFLVERIVTKENGLLKHRIPIQDESKQSKDSPSLKPNKKGAQKMHKPDYRLEPQCDPKPFTKGTYVQKMAHLLSRKSGATEKELLDALNEGGRPKQSRHVKNYFHTISKGYGLGIMAKISGGNMKYYFTNPEDYVVSEKKTTRNRQIGPDQKAIERDRKKAEANEAQSKARKEARQKVKSGTVKKATSKKVNSKKATSKKVK